MRIKKSQLIYLSLLLVGCADPRLPPKPDGLHCTHFEGVFYCNEINHPEKESEFKWKDKEVEKAQCMPLDTFERYQNYVNQLKKLAERNCSQQNVFLNN